MTGRRISGRRADSGNPRVSGGQSTQQDRRRSETEPTTGGRESIPIRFPSPAWVPTEGVIGPCPDRQVLVVGHTPSGFALTLLLRSAGYDPVFVCGADSPTPSRVTSLSPAAVEVLGAIDLGSRVANHGRRVGRVTVRRPGSDDGREGTVGSRTGGSGRAPLVVIPTPVLCRVLGGQIPGSVAAGRRAVESVSPRDGGVAVTFGDGVREWFDLVVDAGGAGESVRRAGQDPDSTSFLQYETTLDGDPDRLGIDEAWRRTAVVQRFPGPTGDRTFLRLTTSETDRSADEVREWVDSNSSEAPRIPDSGAFDRARVRHLRLRGRVAPAAWWGSGRIARCGPAACPVAPAAGIGASLGITDALGLVRTLTREGTTVPDAVATYAARRARRVTALRREATGSDRPLAAPMLQDSPLGSLYALRAVALEPYFGTAPTALREAGGR